MGILKRIRRVGSKSKNGSKYAGLDEQPTESTGDNSTDEEAGPVQVSKEHSKKVTFEDITRIQTTIASNKNNGPVIETKETDNLDDFFSTALQDETPLARNLSHPSKTSIPPSYVSSETFSTSMNSENDESSVESIKSDSSMQYLYRYLTCQPSPEKQALENMLKELRDDASLQMAVESGRKERDMPYDPNTEGRTPFQPNSPSSEAGGEKKTNQSTSKEETPLSTFIDSVCGCPGNKNT